MHPTINNMLNRFRFLLYAAAAFAIVIFDSCNNKKVGRPLQAEADIIHLLNDRLTNVIMQDGFSPPIASRIYAYSNVAAYEAACLGVNGYKSLEHQLHGLDSLPKPEKGQKLDNKIVLISTFAQVANSIVYRDSILQNLADSLVEIYATEGGDAEIKKASLLYAGKLAEAIIGWSLKDGYGATRKMPIYTPFNGPQYWEPTPPKYADAVEPYWNTLRPFVIDSAAAYAVPFSMAFDTVKNSAFYDMCKAVHDSVADADSVRNMIAHFWDDNPMIALSKGHTMLAYRQITPGGHWISITKIVSKQKQLNLQQACDIYMRVSLSMADAFIAAWDLKFKTNLIRPVTYINRYIDAAWKPLLETPPFPEYTCGHSTISAAASQALADYFGDNVDFVDNTNDPYNLPIRTFHSFLKASEEAGMSRMYGGVHYHNSCIVGRNQGLTIARLISARVTTAPPLK